jgi:hypothetical protein
MSKVISRPQKLEIEGSLVAGDGFGCGIVFESLFKDALHAIDVDEFEVQGSLTSGIQRLGAVTIGQAEQLLGGAKSAPGELTRQ